MSNWQPIPGGPWETIFRLPPIETMKTVELCPNHEGAFDCTPFCNKCEGEQEYNV